MRLHFKAAAFLIILTTIFNAGCLGQSPVESVSIVYSNTNSNSQVLAARELQRYIFQRSNRLLPISDQLPRGGDAIVIGIDDKLEAQQYSLKTTTRNHRKLLQINGGSDTGALYGAYHFVEKLGVRFYLHGDVISDEKIAFALPELNETHKPLFELRGLNPWGSHSEGMDLWNTDDWKQVIVQMTKMRLNFIGVHSYPEKGGQYDSEATVWIGPPGDFDSNGQVRKSFSSSYFNTLRTQWGYIPKRTGEYRFGATRLFERDDWGPDVMLDQCPLPTTPEGYNTVFNRSGAMFADAFSLARDLGVKTCIGTESPLVIPKDVKKRLIERGKDPEDPAVVREIYEGMFRRIAATHPLDYYWIWTPEKWLWQGNSDEETKAFIADFKLAGEALEISQASFALATCGWVLGPINDRSGWYKTLPGNVDISALSEAYSGPVDPAFNEIKGRGKWAIPWMEEDDSMLGPQLWAARIRKDAADALAYGCTGLMGLHWRTREIAITASALARAGWSQTGWNPEAANDPPGVPETLWYEGPKPPYGRAYTSPRTIHDPINGTEDDVLYQSYRRELRGYRLRIPKGRYQVNLKFCETEYKASGQREFKVQLQDQTVIPKLDIFARVGLLTALELRFDNVQVDKGWLHLGLEPLKKITGKQKMGTCISAIEITNSHFSRKINCGGEAYKDYEEDTQLTKTFNYGPQGTAYEQRGLKCDDLYHDWAIHSFGIKAGPRIGAMFSKLDGCVPLTSHFDGGAGALFPDVRPWSKVKHEYTFLDELENLAPEVEGAGNRDRYEYWLNMFRHLKAQAKVRCFRGQLDAVTNEARKLSDLAERKAMIEAKVFPLREKLTQLIEEAYQPLLGMVSNQGNLATVINWENHVYRRTNLWPDKALVETYGQPLPKMRSETQIYKGPPRLIVPTVLGLLREGEALKLRVIVLDNHRPSDAALHWRPLGQEEYHTIPLQHIARGVHTVTLVPADERSIEYYITATTLDKTELIWPAGAPRINQTVVVLPSQRK
ncbi:MAG: hypothetical protein MIO92_10405 [Methanosarcinaceae archaeon]|nr:hypothetical protein [Methanosarcinaceae archaeon]